LKLITPNYTGLAIGGGAYPNDPNRSFGTTGLLNLSGNFVGTQTIVAGKTNLYAIPTTLGINTYCPKTDNYCMDVNGPSHYENNSVSSVFVSDFEIKRMRFCRTNPNYGIIIGSPSTLRSPYNHTHYQTSNRGANWTTYNINITNTNDSDVLSTSVSLTDAFIFIYSNYVFTFVVGSANFSTTVNGFILYSNNNGSTWNPILSTGGIADIGPVNGISVVTINNNCTLAVVTASINLFYTINVAAILNLDLTAQFFPFIPTSTGTLVPKCMATFIDTSYGYGNLVFVAGTGGFKIYQLYTSSNPTLFGEYLTTSAVYNIVPPNLYGYSGIGNPCLYNKYDFIAMSIYDLNHILLVGTDLSWNRSVVARIDNIRDSTNWKYFFIDSSANDVSIYDISSASIACNNGIIYYSVDGYYTWQKASLDSYNPFKNAGLAYNSRSTLTNIFVYDINSFFVTKTITPYKCTITNNALDLSRSSLGSSQLFYCYVPSILNKINDNVMDVCGNMRISGDLYVNDTGKLKTLNSSMYVFNENATNIYLGNSASTISVGASYGTTYINHNLDVSINIIGHKNAYIYGDISANGNIIANSNAIINQTLYVLGNSINFCDTYVNGNSYIQGNLLVQQGIFFFGSFNIGQETNLLGNLFVKKNSYISGNAFIDRNITGNANLNILGNTTIKGNAFVMYDLSINGNLYVNGNTIINNHLQINADASMNGTMNINGDTYVVGNLHVTQGTYLGTSLSLSSSLDICGHLNVGDYSSFYGPMSINGPVNINSSINFANNVYIPKMLSVGGISLFIGGLVANHNVTLNGKVNANDDFNVNSNLNVNKILTVSGQISCSIINSLYDSNKKMYMQSNYLYTGSPANKNIYFGALGDTIIMNGSVVYNGGFITKYVGYAQTNSTIMYLNTVSGQITSVYNGNSAGAGIAIQENQNLQQGYIFVSQDLTGYNFKATSYDNSVAQNVLKLDTARLTVSNSNNVNELVILTRPSAYIPTSGQNVPDYSFNMTTSGLSTASLFLRDQVLSDNNIQFVDTDLYVYGLVSFGTDLSVNGTLFITRDTILNGNLIVMVDTSLNGNLKVNGDVSFVHHLCVNGDVSFNSNFTLGQTANLNGNVYLFGKSVIYNDISINSVYLDINANPKFYKKTFFTTDVSINGIFSLNKNATINAGLQVTSGTNIGGGLVIGLDVSFNSRARIHGETNINSRLIVSNDVSFNNHLYLNKNMLIIGDASLNSNLAVNKDVSFNQHLFVGQDVSLNTNLYVNNNVFVNCDLSINGNLFLNGTTIINTDAIVNGNLLLTGNSYLFSSILNSDNTWLNGNTYVDQLTISGTVLGAMDFTMNGNIYLNKLIHQTLIGNNIQYGKNCMLNICGGTQNTAVGFNNLNQNVYGSFNCVFGANALYNSIVDNNTAMGNCALYNNVYGTNNVAFGGNAGYSNMIGDYNTFVGYGADTTNGIWNNSTAIGYNSTIYGNSMVVLGTPNEIIVPMGDVSFNGNLWVNTSINLIGNLNTLGNVNVNGNINALTLNSTFIGSIGTVYTGNVMVNSLNIGIPSYNGNLIVNGYIQQTVGPIENHNMQYGYGALVSTSYATTLCTHNVALGFNSMNQLAGGSFNIGLGNYTLYSLNGGFYNISVGYNCMQAMTGGYSNIGIGARVMMNTGNVSYNVAVGQESLNKLLNGNNNVAYGHTALNGLNNGNDNTSLGYSASAYIYNGIFNVFLGSQAGCTYQSPLFYTNPANNINYNYNTLLGAYTDFYNPSPYSSPVGYGYSYSTAIGYRAQINASHQIVLGTAAENVYCAGTADATTSTATCSLNIAGGAAITKSLVVGNGITCGSINCTTTGGTSGVISAVSYVTTSDYRVKDNVKSLDESYSVDQLRPVSFTNRLNNKNDVGFIAHELQEIYPDLVTGEKDGSDHQTINYISLIGILVNEVQSLKSQLRDMRNILDHL
jgi:UDP-3-O-[3-hydroxymyristoyl] glucosamine N-acyltransferase